MNTSLVGLSLSPTSSSKLLLDNCSCLLAGPSASTLASYSLEKATRMSLLPLKTPGYLPSEFSSNTLCGPAALLHLISRDSPLPHCTPTGLQVPAAFPVWSPPRGLLFPFLLASCPSGLSPTSYPQESFPAQVTSPYHVISQHQQLSSVVFTTFCNHTFICKIISLLSCPHSVLPVSVYGLWRQP